MITGQLGYLWQRHLSSLLRLGAPVETRGHQTVELLDNNLHLVESGWNVILSSTRNLNYRFMVAEWLWMMFGRDDVASIARYNSKLKEFSDDGVSFAGAYGPHIADQWHRVVRKLSADPNTRQAVITIPRPKHDTKDEPCTLSFQFLLRDGHLNAITTMRSNDAWLGTPYDVFNFTQLQNVLAGVLGVKRGWFSLHAGSAHLYAHDARLATALQADLIHTLRSPALPGHPPFWLLEVMLYRDVTQVPADAGVWRPYAEALLATSSAEALQCLHRAAKL